MTENIQTIPDATIDAWSQHIEKVKTVVQEPIRQSSSDPSYLVPISRDTNPWQSRPNPFPPASPTPPPVYTLEGLTEDINKTGEAFLAAREEYEENRGKDLYGKRIGEIATQLAVLEPQVAALRSELRELESKPTPEVKFVQSVVAASREVMGCGRKVAAYLYERFSQKIFGYPYARLSNDENVRIIKWNAQDIEPFKHEGIPLIENVQTPVSCELKIDGLLEKLTAISDILNRLHKESSNS
jgi:hypothetical protein